MVPCDRAQMHNVNVRSEVDEEAHRRFCVECFPLIDWCRSCSDRELYMDYVPQVTLEQARASPFSITLNVSDSSATSASRQDLHPAFAVALDPLATAAAAVEVLFQRVHIVGYTSFTPGAGVSVATGGYDAGANTAVTSSRARVTVALHECHFRRLEAAHSASGGAFAVHLAGAGEASVTVRDSTVRGCVAAVSGGGMSFRFAGDASETAEPLHVTVAIDGGEFSSNIAGSGGGAVVASAAGAAQVDLNITGAVLSGNAANSGGAVELFTEFVIDESWPRVQARTAGITCKDNSVKSGGGGCLKLVRATARGASDVFQSNYGGPNGGHVFATGGSVVECIDGAFSGGDAAFGGAVSLRGSVATMLRCSFSTMQGCVVACLALPAPPSLVLWT